MRDFCLRMGGSIMISVFKLSAKLGTICSLPKDAIVLAKYTGTEIKCVRVCLSDVVFLLKSKISKFWTTESDTRHEIAKLCSSCSDFKFVLDF